MTKAQITCFLTVARERSFTRAANMLYISQPAISKSVTSLESELGVKLFERRSGMPVMTQAGEMMYEFFVRVGGELDTLLEKIEDLKDAFSAPIRLGCPDSWNPAVFYGKLSSHFAAAHPEMALSVECFRLSELMLRLDAGELDAVLTHDFYSPNQYGISSEYVTETGFGILYSKERFGEVRAVSDFGNVSFLLYDNDIQKKFEGFITDICRKSIMPTLKNVGQLSTALFDTACGKGVMLFSDWDSAASNPVYGYLPIEQRIPVKLIYRSDRLNPLMDVFVKETPALFRE